jgi:lysophospholipase L1-like esterase
MPPNKFAGKHGDAACDAHVMPDAAETIDLVTPGGQFVGGSNFGASAMRFLQVTLGMVAIAALVISPVAAKELDPTRWERTIASFERADRKHPPPRDAVLFVGSSSIATWANIQSYFPDDVVINRGFGGSTFPEVTYFVDRIVFPYRPRLIVVYCGGNDMALFGHTPEMLRDSFRTFVEKVRSELRDVPIVYISLHWPPRRRNQKEAIEKANELIRAEIARQSKVTFVDIHGDMLGPDGKPNRELYKDSLHPGPKGYEIWVSKLLPYIEATRRTSTTGKDQRGPTRPEVLELWVNRKKARQGTSSAYR